MKWCFMSYVPHFAHLRKWQMGQKMKRLPKRFEPIQNWLSQKTGFGDLMSHAADLFENWSSAYLFYWVLLLHDIYQLYSSLTVRSRKPRQQREEREVAVSSFQGKLPLKHKVCHNTTILTFFEVRVNFFKHKLLALLHLVVV